MSRRFGVEIEFLSTVTTERVLMSLRAAGIRVESSYYTHDTTPYWKIVTDGSCGLELVSPVLEGEAGIEEVRIAAAALEAAGAQVDRRCGLHVHFDARSMNLKAVKNLFKLWLKFEDVLDTFQPQSRRGNNNTYCRTNLESGLKFEDVLDTFQPQSRRGNNNTYCRTNLESGVSDSEDHRGQCHRLFNRIDACKNMDEMRTLYSCRYRKLNIQSYFRHHSGTTCPEKITNWVRLMARMFDAAESAAAVRNRPEDTGIGMGRMKWFFQAIDARGLTKFYTARAKKLAA